MDTRESLWLAEYRKGDVEALGKLVEHCRRPLFGFILKMTEGREDADEIFQETWFRAIRSLETYRDNRFLSWLFRIAHNLIIDRARRAKPVAGLAAPGEDGDAADPIETRVADKGIGPSAAADGRDLGRRITSAVSRLPPEQRAVFLMRMEGDLPFKDIARIQGTSINTALARMQYALAKLRNELKTDYADVARVRP
ncbi:MAG: sigma-70 family RNA polymerase sigma factor [Verrucomicrobiota bacterium]